jgi:hypothetical protein
LCDEFVKRRGIQLQSPQIPSRDSATPVNCIANDIERLAVGARGHWGVESLPWLLDVAFKDDLSRYRTGHGAD